MRRSAFPGHPTPGGTGTLALALLALSSFATVSAQDQNKLHFPAPASSPVATPQSPSAPPPQAATRPADSVLRDIRAIGRAGGTDKWDNAVRPILLAAYDSNRSGSIDTIGEVTAIPCDVLKVLDEIIRPYDNNRSGLTWTYGFKPGNYTYLGEALGFATPMRAPAFTHMQRCGVRTGA